MSGAPKISAAALFNGVTGAKMRMDGNYERAGIYYEIIRKVRFDVSRKAEAFVAIEKTVIHVVNPMAADHASQPGSKPHVVGEDVTHMMMKKHDSFLGNILGFVLGTTGLDLREKPEAEALQALADICGDKQPLEGTVVECQNRITMTRPKPNAPLGTPFTQIVYKREVPALELQAILTPEQITRFFPGETFNQMLAIEAEAKPAA